MNRLNGSIAKWLLPQPGEDKQVVMAKTAGALYLSMAAVWVMLRLFSAPEQASLPTLDFFCLIGVLIGLVFFAIDWRQIPFRVFHFTTTLTLVYIALFVYFSGGAASPYSILYFLVIFWSSFFYSPKENLVVIAAATGFTLLPYLYEQSDLLSRQMASEVVFCFLYLPVGFTVYLLSRQKEQDLLRERTVAMERGRFASHLQTLQQISHGLTAELELNRLLQMILSEGLRLLDFEVAGFLLWDPDEEAFVLRAVANLPQDIVGQKLRRGEGLAGRVAEEKKIVIIHDYISMNQPMMGIATLNLKSHMGTPIFWKGEVIGAFNMGTSQPNKVITETEQALAVMLAQHAAAAIANARLFQHSTEQARRQALLHKMVYAVSSEMSPQEVLHHLAQIAADAVRGNFAVLLLKEGEALIPKGAYQIPPVEIPFFSEAFKIAAIGEESPALLAIRERRAITIPHLESEKSIPLPLREEATRFGFASLIAVPLLFQEEVYGALAVYFPKSGLFRAQEIEMLSAIATEAASAVLHLKWIEERERHLARTETLREIAQEIGAESNRRAVLDLVVQRGCALMEMEEGGILLRNRERPGLLMQVFMGSPPAQIGQAFESNAVTEPILRERRTVTVEDRPDLFETLPFSQGRSIQSAIGAPILVQGEAVGILFLQTKTRGRTLDHEDGKTIEILARYAAIAIENDRLHAEAAALNEQFALLTKEISLSRNLDQIFFHISEGLKRHLPFSQISLGLFDEAYKEVRLLRIIHPERAAGMARWPQENSAIYSVLSHQRPVICSDLAASRIYREDRFLFEEGIRSYAILPVMLRGKAIATLNLKSDRAGQFSETLVDSLLPFANHLAPFIENARLFEELTQKKKEAEEASRLKTEFLSNVSHELRTPLNAIIGYTHLLLAELYGPLQARQTQSLGSVRRNAHSLLSLINNLLDLSKIEAGKVEAVSEPFDLKHLLLEVFEDIKPLLGEKRIEVRWRLPEALSPLRSDPLRVQQVFLNLLSNAIKFTERGAITITVREKTIPRGILLSIEDTGIGMKKEDIPTIFDPFRQIDGSLTRSVEGTGLGLAIVKKSLLLIGGTIDVQSEVGKGSCFKIFLPHLEEPLAEAEAPAGSFQKREKPS